MNFVRLAALAVTIGLAPACASAAAPTIQSAQADIARWASDLGAWSQSVNDAQRLELTLLTQGLQGAGAAQKYHSDADQAAGRQWAAEWVAQERAGLAELSEKTNSLNAEPPLPPKYFMGTPAIADMVPRYRALGQAELHGLHEGIDLMSSLLVLIEKTAGGDDEAAHALGPRTSDVSIALVNMEIAGLDAAAVATPEHHPGGPHLRAMIEADDAFIALLKFNRDEHAGKSPSAEQCAMEIRRHADTMVAAARQIGPEIDPALKTAEGLGPVMHERTSRAFASYRKTADVDLLYAEKLRSMADLIAGGEHLGSDKMQAVQVDIAAVVQKEQALDQFRKQTLAGQQ